MNPVSIYRRGSHPSELEETTVPRGRGRLVEHFCSVSMQCTGVTPALATLFPPVG
jgi:hypothetical protein